MFSKFILFTGLTLMSGSAFADSWVIEEVDRVGAGNRETSFKVDSQGRVHYAYTGCTKDSCRESVLKYAIRSIDGNWQRFIVDSKGSNTGWMAAIVLDSNDIPHIFYNDRKKIRLKHATINRTNRWSVNKISKGGWWIGAASQGDQIYFAHQHRSKRFTGKDYSSYLELGMVLPNGDIQKEFLDKGNDVGSFASIAIDKFGSPVIAYNYGDSYPYLNLRLKYKVGEQWKTVTVDSETQKAKVAVDSQNQIHMVYNRVDQSNSGGGLSQTTDLYYFTIAADGKRKISSIDRGARDTDHVGLFSSIAIDQNDGLHVFYSDFTNKRIRYAKRAADPNSKWTFTDPVKFGGQPMYTDAVIDQNGTVHLSYEAAGLVKYARCEDCAQ